MCIYRAVGNVFYGQQYRENIVDTVRKEAERCDALQCFFVMHSMGGGVVHLPHADLSIILHFIRNWIRSRHSGTGSATKGISRCLQVQQYTDSDDNNLSV